VRFDDRLLTVLNQPADDRHDAAVRWRQLVDLVARAGPHGGSPAVSQALTAIREEAPQVDEHLRSAAARSVAALPLPLALLEYFAADRLAVSAPVLAAATLDQGQWRALMDVADDETRRFIETLHPELKGAEPKSAEPTSALPLDLTDALVEPAPEQPVRKPPVAPPPSPSLHDVVTRIERRRRLRNGAGSAPAAGEGALPPDSPALFRWECGPSGEIAWVDGAPRGALIGRSIGRAHETIGDQVDQQVVRAFALRAPFRDALLNIGGRGPVSGEWKISGVPAFDPADGRFAGYRGVALREAPAGDEPTEPLAELLSDPDSVRELVHEIKTPLNAIIGFAEIIEGQYLGPADRRYRGRAQEIVAQARLLLTAIDDLDFAAKVRSASGDARRSCDIGAVVETVSDSVRSLAADRQVAIEIARPSRTLRAAIDADLAGRLVVRVAAAVIEHGAAGERLRLSVDQLGDRCRLSLTRPKALHGVADEILFGAREQGRTGDFGLRLARGLARVAGGDVIANDAAVALVLPRA
jgi:signal transduction histidine kinase